MEILFEKSFEKDLKKINAKKTKEQLRKIIDEVREASCQNEIRNIKKIQGHSTFYRIRLGDYRIGIEIIENEVIFTRILHRKDIYRYFP